MNSTATATVELLMPSNHENGSIQSGEHQTANGRIPRRSVVNGRGVEMQPPGDDHDLLCKIPAEHSNNS